METMEESFQPLCGVEGCDKRETESGIVVVLRRYGIQKVSFNNLVPEDLETQFKDCLAALDNYFTR